MLDLVIVGSDRFIQCKILILGAGLAPDDEQIALLFFMNIYAKICDYGTEPSNWLDRRFLP